MKMSPLTIALLGLALALVAAFLFLFMREGDEFEVGVPSASSSLEAENQPTGAARRNRREAPIRKPVHESSETEGEKNEASSKDLPGDRPVVRGRVLAAADGTPVAGAKVGLVASAIIDSFFSLDLSKVLRTVQSPNRPLTVATTDEKGLFRIPQAAPGDYMVLVTAQGFGRRFSDSFRVPEVGEVGDVSVRMKPAIRFEGIVQNRDGLAVSGVQVNLFDTKRKRLAVLRTYQSTTDREGRFIFPDLEAGRYEGTLLADGYGATGMGRVVVDEKKVSASPDTYVLEPGGEVYGRVFDATTGRGLAGAVVYVLAEFKGSGLPAYFETRSGEDGAYVVKGASTQGTIIVGAHLEGFSVERGPSGRAGQQSGIRVKASERSGGRDLVDLPMVGGAVVNGRVLASGSLAPIAGARVVIYSPRAVYSVGKTRPVVTDENGGVHVRDVPAGRFVVAVSHPDFVAATQGLNEDIFQEQVEEADEEEEGDASADRVQTLAPGEVRDGIQVVMAPAARIRGRVVDAGGASVAAARVDFRTDRKRNPFLDMTFKSRSHVVSDAEGRFELPSVPKRKKVVVEARHPRYVSPDRRTLDLTDASPPSDLTLVLGPGATLVGATFGGEGGPLAGAKVVLESKDAPVEDGLGLGARDRGRKRFSATTDAEGHFRIEEIPAGAYAVSLQKKSIETLKLRAGEKRSVELRLPREVAITGVVVRDDGSVFPGVSVVATAVKDADTATDGKRPRQRRVTSDERGRFRIVVLEGQRYEIRGWRIAEKTDRAGKTRRAVWASDLTEPQIVEAGDQNVRVVLTRQ